MNAETRDLQCPYCGYVVVNDTGIGVKHCGPHVNWRGEHSPAVQMREIPDGAEAFQNSLSSSPSNLNQE